MDPSESLPRPVSGQDAEALLGLVIEAEAVLLDDPNPELVGRLSRRFSRAGLMDDVAGLPELRLTLSNLNLRLRYALGEFESAPSPDLGLTEHQVAFAAPDETLRFCDVMRDLGMACRHGDHDPGTGVSVMVTVTDLWLSPAFDRAQERIERAAASCGGTYRGFGGTLPGDS